MESFTNFISTIELKNYAGIFYAILLFLFLFGLVWLRTRSTHTLMSRLWKISHGKSECADIEIKEILDGRSALMQFRFTTGIRIRLHSQIKPLIQWANKNHEDIDDIARCGTFFNLEKPDLERKTGIEKALLFIIPPILSFSLFIMFIFSTATALTDQALVNMKESGNWILINKDIARRIDYFYLVNYKAIKKSDCENITEEEKVRISLGEKDMKIICKLLKEQNKIDIDFLNQTVKEQKIFFPIFAFIFLIFTVITAKFILNFFRSLAMESRLKKIANIPIEDFSI